MEQKTIKKDFIKVDDENFKLVETRETTTEVNLKRINIELKTFRNNLKQDVSTIMKNTNAVRLGCEKFNAVLVDLSQAAKELGIEISMLDEISFDLLSQEIIDEEKAINAQKEQLVKNDEKKEIEEVKEEDIEIVSEDDNNG